MTRLIEGYYYLAIPVVLLTVAFAIFQKKRRVLLILTSAAIAGVWYMSMLKLEARSSVILRSNFSSSDEIIRTLGAPDSIVDYPEGDSEWVYSVRVWPWNAVAGFSVYKKYILGTSLSEKAGIFYKREKIFRTEKASKIVRNTLMNYDKESR